MMERDQVLTDGQIIKTCAVTLQAFETPEHTMGTASFSFDAFDGAKRYRAFTVGGLRLNAISREQVEAYIASTNRIRPPTQSKIDPVTTQLTTHPFSNGHRGAGAAEGPQAGRSTSSRRLARLALTTRCAASQRGEAAGPGTRQEPN